MLQLTEEDLRSRVLGAFVGLSVFYTIGAITFVAVERENELFTYEINQVLYNDMKSMYQFKHCDDSSFKNLAFCRDQREFSEILEEFFNDHGNSVEDKEQWTYLGSVFFLTQLTATIGYGNTACATTLGKMLTVVFLIVGMPLMGYVIFTTAVLDQYLTRKLSKSMGISIDSDNKQIAMLLVLFAVFLLLGSLVFHVLEGWTYLEALYFSFTTLTTIGFGDYLPSTHASKIFAIFYIILGLGNCASIIAVLTVKIVARTHFGLDAYIREKLTCLSRE
jgi:hypothetical protein